MKVNITALYSDYNDFATIPCIDLALSVTVPCRDRDRDRVRVPYLVRDRVLVRVRVRDLDRVRNRECDRTRVRDRVSVRDRVRIRDHVLVYLIQFICFYQILNIYFIKQKQINEDINHFSQVSQVSDKHAEEEGPDFTNKTASAHKIRVKRSRNEHLNELTESIA